MIQIMSLVSPGTKPLPDSMLTQIFDGIMASLDVLGANEFIQSPC